VILIGIVLIGALIYVVDFLNPLTPDPPGILDSLQWRILVSFAACILALNIPRPVRIKFRAPSLEIRSITWNGPPAIADTAFIIDLNCSRLI
jgi:hypothetical protein